MLTPTRCHVNVRFLPPFMPEATSQTNFKRYLSVWLASTTICLFMHEHRWQSPCTHTHSQVLLLRARTHTQFRRALSGSHLWIYKSIWPTPRCSHRLTQLLLFPSMPSVWNTPSMTSCLETGAQASFTAMAGRQGQKKQARSLLMSVFTDNPSPWVWSLFLHPPWIAEQASNESNITKG